MAHTLAQNQWSIGALPKWWFHFGFLQGEFNLCTPKPLCLMNQDAGTEANRGVSSKLHGHFKPQCPRRHYITLSDFRRWGEKIHIGVLALQLRSDTADWCSTYRIPGLVSTLTSSSEEFGYRDAFLASDPPRYKSCYLDLWTWKHQ